MSKDIFILVGPPGSGKGSLSRLCVQRLGWHQISTGNLCRQHIANKTEIGNKIDFLIKSGKLIPDELVINMVADWLDVELGISEPAILDGFPRTISQISALHTLLSNYQNIRVHVVKMAINSDTVLKRMLSRIICKNSNCQAIYSELDGNDCICKECGDALMKRSDDSLESIKTRLSDYSKTEEAMLDEFKKMDYPIIMLNVEQPLENVYKEFIGSIS